MKFSRTTISLSGVALLVVGFASGMSFGVNRRADALVLQPVQSTATATPSTTIPMTSINIPAVFPTTPPTTYPNPTPTPLPEIVRGEGGFYIKTSIGANWWVFVKDPELIIRTRVDIGPAIPGIDADK